MKTVYEADGTAVTLNPIDARQRIAVGLAFEKPPGAPVVVDPAPLPAQVEKLPDVPLSAYALNGAPLVESERPVPSLRRGRPPKTETVAG